MQDDNDRERDTLSSEVLPPHLAECFPAKGALFDTVQWCLTTTHAPPVYQLGAAISFGTLEMARRGWCVDNAGVLQPPAIWIVLIGDPATAKSTVYQRWRTLYSAYLRDELGALFHRAPFVEGEGTIPGLLAAFDELYDPGLDRTPALLMLDEFSGLLRMAERQTEQLCRIADQESIERHLSSAKKEQASTGKAVAGTRLRNPAISGFFCTTPEGIGDVANRAMADAGFFSRLVFLRARLAEFTPRPRQNLDEGRFREIVRIWRAWSGWLHGTQLSAPARVAVFSEECNRYLQNQLIEQLYARLTEGSRLNAYLVRAIGHAHTIASLYALSQHRLDVNEDDLDRAINFVFLYLDCANVLTRTTAVHVDVALAGRVYNILEEYTGRWVTKSVLYHRLNTAKKQLDDAIEVLLDAERIERMMIPTTKKGGRPGVAFRIPGEPDKVTSIEEARERREPPPDEAIIRDSRKLRDDTNDVSQRKSNVIQFPMLATEDSSDEI